MKLSQETWVRVYPWLEQAQEVPAPDLQEWIARLVAEQPEIGIPLRDVLAQSACLNDDGFLVEPCTLTAGRRSPAGQSFGAYAIDTLLAQGGMGEVWLAHRSDGHFEGKYAVKLLHVDMPGTKALERFKREGRVLARLTHPNIARLMDAGATPEGQPFLVLEYIDGEHIDKYCESRSLSTQARVQLFLNVLAAISHAHTSLIIHRDIKPSNVLVTPGGVVKLLDFGIAKLVSADLTPAERGPLTRVEDVALTPNYAAPEQILGEPLSTATDVYQLAVLLHVLLVGRLPLGTLGSTRSERVMAALRETPVRMSDTVSGSLRKELRGDLDAIIEKSLRKDPAERYPTAAALSADLQRYLEHQPVAARDGLFAYRARKFVRRYRGAVISGTAVLASLLIATAVSLTQTHRMRLARDSADQITGFMKQMFKVSDPSEARGNTVTAREILDQSARQIGTVPGLDAGVQADLLQVMADTYMNLGLYARAHTLAQTALDSRRRLLGPEDPKTLESLQQLGDLLFLEGHTAEAEDSLRRTLTLELRILGPEHLHTLETEDTLLNILVSKGLYAESEQLERQLVATETRTLGQGARLTLRSMKVLGSALREQSRFVEAEALYRQLVAIERSSLGPDHPDTFKASLGLADLLQSQGRYAEAEAVYRESLASRRRVLGDEHPETADARTHLANDLVHDRTRYKEAEELYRTALAVEQRQVGPESRFTTRAEEGLANLLVGEDRYVEAEPLFREVLRVRQKVLGADNTDTLITQYNLADLINDEGRPKEAEQLFRSTLEQQERVMGPDHPDTLASRYMLADALLQENRPGEAEPLARRAFETQLRLLGPQHSDTLSGLARFAQSLAALGRYEEAKQLYATTIAKLESLPAADLPRAWYDFAGVAALAGHPDDALADLGRAIQLGYADVDGLRTAASLKALHQDPRFAKLVQRLQNASVSAKGPI